MTQSDNIFTVSRLNAQVRLLLENEMGLIWLMGEISNFSMPSSGHWYFTLKDSQAQVKCAMFRGKNTLVSFRPSNGNQVLVRARISLYEPRGDYQIIVESMQPEGEGRLKQEFEKLKIRLSAEGLFSTNIKLPLPTQPKKVGVITSPTGAALHDILHVLKRRDPSLAVVIYPTQVQGKDASFQIAQAIGRANTRKECDVIILGRGGGSLEDLWCFNEEIVARTIAASQIPIISAVGHETDVSISDFVADVRAPTPSAAAEIVSQDSSYKTQQLRSRFTTIKNHFEKILQQKNTDFVKRKHKLALLDPKVKLQQQTQHLDELERRLIQSMLQKIQVNKSSFEKTEAKLQQLSPKKFISQSQREIDFSFQRLADSIKRHLAHKQYEHAVKMETLNAVSPLSTLNRGYTVTLDANNQLIRTIEDVNIGQEITTRLKQGIIRSVVSKTSISD